MKRMIVMLLIVLFAVVSCDSVNELKEAGKEVRKAVDESGKLKSAAENVKEGSDVVKGIPKQEIEEPVLNKDDVFVYFSELKKAAQKYPDIDFYSATTAAIQAGTQGLNLKDIIERETELTFKKYQTTGIHLLTAQTEGQGLMMQEDMLTQMKEGRKNAEEQVDVEKLSEEEREKFLKQMDQLNKTIEETEKELQSENVERIRNNMKIIEEAKENADIE